MIMRSRWRNLKWLGLAFFAVTSLHVTVCTGPDGFFISTGDWFNGDDDDGWFGDDDDFEDDFEDWWDDAFDD
jgi:hypothetical protein